ncbi:unnamed protein product [Paramecium pentaurelia]|uniref:Uncharacterized protein n=1 Tax=Paramecium pentaurelia TaxID=43138 RepID=A0A8S1SX44_9CILI|nr:unnamed protein product [Paramecium pentaurelia]
MNSSKTSRTVKALHLFHLEQKNSDHHHYNIPTFREPPIPTILKPSQLSPSKQSFPVSRQNQENGYTKITIEKKILQLRKEILNAKYIKQKLLQENDKLQLKDIVPVQAVEKPNDKQVKPIKYCEKKSKSKVKFSEIQITLQERQLQQSILSTQINKIPKFKLKEKQTLTIEDRIDDIQKIPQCQSSIKLRSEPNSPQIIKKLQSYQFSQRRVSQGNVQQPKKIEVNPWSQNLEGWHAPQADEDLLVYYQQCF